jgi:hypothetical protein
LGCGGWTLERPGTEEITPDVAHLRHFATDPAAVKKGIGRAIFRECAQAAAKAGAKMFKVYSSLNAEPFYKSLGLSRVEQIELPITSTASIPTDWWKGWYRWWPDGRVPVWNSGSVRVLRQWKPPPDRLAVIKRRLEGWWREHGMYVKDFRADVSEAVFAADWNNKRLPANQNSWLIIDPNLGFTCNNGKYFLNRMTMCGGAHSRCYPLLKYAQLNCTVGGRNTHSGFYSCSPFLARLFYMWDYLHR